MNEAMVELVAVLRLREQEREATWLLRLVGSIIERAKADVAVGRIDAAQARLAIAKANIDRGRQALDRVVDDDDCAGVSPWEASIEGVQ